MKSGRARRPRSRRWAALLIAALAACGVSGSLSPAALAGTSSVQTWAKLAPLVHPSARDGAPMAYDAATGAVALFAGHGRHRFDNGTFTWG